MSVTIRCEDWRGDDVDATGRAAKGQAVNFANANAWPIIAIMADANPLIHDLACGEIPPSSVASAYERVHAAATNDAVGMMLRSSMLRSAVSDGNYHACGSDDARACERLRAVLTVLSNALARGVGVSWDGRFDK